VVTQWDAWPRRGISGSFFEARARRVTLVADIGRKAPRRHDDTDEHDKRQIKVRPWSLGAGLLNQLRMIGCAAASADGVMKLVPVV